MSKIKNIAGWTVDFRTGAAYICLSEGSVALRSDKDGAIGLIYMDKIPPSIRDRIEFTGWDHIEHIPFVQFFGKQKMIIR